MNSLQSLGADLYIKRQELGLMAFEAARDLGIDKSLLLRIERGEEEFVQPFHLWKMAKRYGLSYRDLMIRAGNPEEKAIGFCGRRNRTRVRFYNFNTLLPHWVSSESLNLYSYLTHSESLLINLLRKVAL